jgi:hypothetical protein
MSDLKLSLTVEIHHDFLYLVTSKIVNDNFRSRMSVHVLARLFFVPQDNLPLVPSNPFPVGCAIGKDQQESSGLDCSHPVLQLRQDIVILHWARLELVMPGAARPASVTEHDGQIMHPEEAHIQLDLLLRRRMNIHQVARVHGALQEADSRRRVFRTGLGWLKQIGAKRDQKSGDTNRDGCYFKDNLLPPRFG